MFVCISPAEGDAPETACSLTFAARVRNVELGPSRRHANGGTDLTTEVKLRERDREVPPPSPSFSRHNAPTPPPACPPLPPDVPSPPTPNAPPRTPCLSSFLTRTVPQCRPLPSILTRARAQEY